MKLQIALDELSIDQGIALCRTVRGYIDIIEIGTPFIVREGLHAVRAFRREFPDKEILADAKIMDAGGAEAADCFESGADYVTVLAVTDILTVRACVDTAERYRRSGSRSWRRRASGISPSTPGSISSGRAERRFRICAGCGRAPAVLCSPLPEGSIQIRQSSISKPARTL